MPLDKKQKNEIFKKLVDLEKELEEEVQGARLSSQPVKLDQQSVGRVSRIDAIQQQQMQLASLQRLERRLQMVKAAQSRVGTEEFGYCVKCEEPIDIQRLKAVPESPVCVKCAGKN